MNDSINVTLTVRDSKTNEVKKVIKKHNIVSKQAVLTMARLIDGQFCDADNVNLNRTKRLDLYDYIPHYFAMGSNVVSSDVEGSAGVTNVASINDTRLLSEYKDFPRLKITQRNLVEDDPNKPYVKLVIRHYVPVSAYFDRSTNQGYRLGEAGLFTSEKGNTCWARVVFDYFVKDPLTVIDVEWEITIVSLESTSQLYETIDKSSLWMAIEDACIKLEEKDPSLLNLPQFLKEGIKDYADDEVEQDKVDEDTDNINNELDILS